MSSARDAMKRSASVAAVISCSGCSRISLMASPTGVPPGSRTATQSTPTAVRRSASKRICVVLPAPSLPSKTTSFPRVIQASVTLGLAAVMSGEGDDGTCRPFLHPVHDPLIHPQHQLVEVLLRRDGALISRLGLNLLQHRIQLLFHFGRWILSALNEILGRAAQLFHFLKQNDCFLVVVERFTRPLERLILCTLTDHPPQFLRFILNHSFSFLDGLDPAGEHESFASSEIEQKFYLADTSAHANTSI